MMSLKQKSQFSQPVSWLSYSKNCEIQQKKAFCPTYGNLFAYAANNPVRYIDPTGLTPADTLVYQLKNGTVITVNSDGDVTVDFSTGEKSCAVAIIRYSNDRNGTKTGTMDVYSRTRVGVFLNTSKAKDPNTTVPVVSGGYNNESACPGGAYEPVNGTKTSNSGNPILKDSQHGGSDNIYYKFNVDIAIHQGNNKLDITTQKSEGCAVVTGNSSREVVDNYNSVKKTIGVDRVLTIVIE